ncbi:MAG TPA: peptidoglycan DD-metalloendopeptidase family protein [Flavobacteriales bacterium]|jgi:septal ring factor EnvC (AmiA/AmiB activator)|nr:peptidoglycan DD-metalloendopeptidase family protein [Flavobacteriales bacterium]MBK7113637.1 peptidoglycan DD-metalloendopeptidase family protein [Flavobacteriales bacterium]MBK8530999.1 peptidoglycan DD-metalloendopeptidase family protein [Flavobacteriales bacterium]MBP8876724.1 peptidoglycan DD-metalloendopeptidase family protein [Flavobacteriales bacterium]MBP9176791.1 peptidoglycan DD-metalloendopeptidase family protein [Flavobacteriales bacterium]
MKPLLVRTCVGLLLLLITLPLQAQGRKDLEKKRASLDKQIKTTTALIEQAKKEQRVTQEQLQLLESQIQAREQLIHTMNSELHRVEQRITEDVDLVASLENDLVRLKEEYGRMLLFAYRNRSAYDRMSYLFASTSFQQAYKRSRYLAQIAEQRTRQAALISETRATIDQRLSDLQAQRTEKSQLVNQQQAERQRLNKDRNGQQSALSGLKKEEGRLRETQKKQENQRRDLDAAIRKAIEAELKPKTSAGNKPGASGKLDLTLTPEAKELNADFEKNKGKLPWPVEKGVITSRFGKQPHPVLPGIVIENNGIDITTEKNATVRALFRGEVSSVIVIPGAGKAVILSHGVYRTVYSNLREVSVEKGQKAETKAGLGTVLAGDNGSVAHVELWKITADGLVKVDPGPWLFR